MEMFRDLEALIERAAERKMDDLDHLFLSGKLSQEDYDEEVQRLDRWVVESLADSRSITL